MISFEKRTTTTDATATTTQSITMTADTMLWVRAIVAARRTGGSAGTAGDSAGYVITATYKKVGAGSATLVGAVLADFTAEDQAGWDATFDVSTNDVRLRITGAVNNNITWKSKLSYILVPT